MIASWSTIPFAIVAATATETNAPAKLSTAALATAARGLSARGGDARRDRVGGVVEAVREVEEQRDRDDGQEHRFIGVPSRTRVRRGYAFLTTMFAIVFAAVSQLSSARSSRS